MGIIKGIFNTALIVAVFSAGFYVRHKVDPAFEAVERIEEGKAKAASLWPF